MKFIIDTFELHHEDEMVVSFLAALLLEQDARNKRKKCASSTGEKNGTTEKRV